MMSSEEGKRANLESGPKMQSTGKIGGGFELQANAGFLADREAYFESLQASYSAYLSEKPKEPIVVTLGDGSTRPGVSWETTPLNIAQKISKKLVERAVVAKVKYTRLIAPDEGLVSADSTDEPEAQEADFVLYDLSRPLEGDCQIQILTFDDQEGKVTFWHSSAHILGASLERAYGAYLTVGPPLNPGFFYDCYMGENTITQDNFAEVEKVAGEIVSAKFPYQRVVITKEEALKLFSYNPFKVQLINRKIPDGGKTTAYRCGFFIDLCTGPHVPDTGKVKAFKVTKNSSAYWLGKAENDSLQRLYGVSFPNNKELQEYVRIQEELAKRDHRRVGVNQELFFWHHYSAGSTFFLPNGARIYNRLVEFIKKEYRFRGFEEVVTPNIYNCDLWRTSGHYKNYRENLFLFEVEKQEWAMKPMNCPGHCLMFDHIQRSYKELPIRMADFGVLHRNELSGALGGLTRVRRFCQDDAHIFCRRDQISEEVSGCLEFLSYIYSILGFNFEFELSTRPEKALGDIALWTQAEAQLAEALDKGGYPWKLNPGDGAFYGPKIDIQVYDAFGRTHQCGTVQLDFNLPIRFNLQYKAEHVSEEPFVPVEYEDYVEKPCKPGFERPVIIHRAILGSIERMFAILTEHYGGKWPFWLSPQQIVICSISDEMSEYAQRLARALWIEGYYADADVSNQTLNKKVRNAQVRQVNYIGVVGEQEKSTGTVDIRDRDSNRSIGKFTVQELLKMFAEHKIQPSPAQLAMKSSAFEDDAVEVKEVFKLADLDAQLAHHTFLEGENISQRDWKLFEALSYPPVTDKYPHLARWYQHLASLK